MGDEVEVLGDGGGDVGDGEGRVGEVVAESGPVGFVDAECGGEVGAGVDEQGAVSVGGVRVASVAVTPCPALWA